MAYAGSSVYFGSGAAKPVRDLTNFQHAPLTLVLSAVPTYVSLLPAVITYTLDAYGITALRFISSEHAWQALKAADYPTFMQFLENGSIGSADVVPRNVCRALWRTDTPNPYWWAKGFVGVVPKMAVTPRTARKLALAIRERREYLPAEVETAVWREILLAKFRAAVNVDWRKLLLHTKGVQLVEFDRGARRPRGSHWGGVIEPDGSVTGGNAMGRLLMGVRDTLLQELAQ